MSSSHPGPPPSPPRPPPGPPPGPPPSPRITETTLVIHAPGTRREHWLRLALLPAFPLLGPARETPRAVGLRRPPRAGLREGPAVTSGETPARCRGAGGCSVLPVTDSDEPALPWGGGQLWVRRCFPCLPGTKAAERRDAVAVDRTEASSPEGPGHGVS